jgi:hypothetical protein
MNTRREIMIGVLFFALGFIFLVVIVLSLLVNPALAQSDKSAEDSRSKELLS